MAGICSIFKGVVNADIMQFVCDSEDEIDDLPTTTEVGKGVFEKFNHTASIGSYCQVGNEGGDLIIYELFSFGWKKIS